MKTNESYGELLGWLFGRRVRLCGLPIDWAGSIAVSSIVFVLGAKIFSEVAATEGLLRFSGDEEEPAMAAAYSSSASGGGRDAR